MRTAAPFFSGSVLTSWSVVASGVSSNILAPLVNPMLTGTREQYRAIPAETVAKAMVGAVRRGGRGVYRYTYAAINQLAEFKPMQTIPAPAGKKTSG